MRVKTPYNAHEFAKNHETNTMPSKTIPDQTMSIREIMTRFTRGLPIDGEKVPIYEEEDFLPDLRGLDLAERQELKEIYQAELDEIRERAKLKKSTPHNKTEEIPFEEVTQSKEQIPPAS